MGSACTFSTSSFPQIIFLLYACITFGKKKQINIYFTKKKLQRVDSPTEMLYCCAVVMNRQNTPVSLGIGTLKCDPMSVQPVGCTTV